MQNVSMTWFLSMKMQCRSPASLFYPVIWKHAAVADQQSSPRIPGVTIKLSLWCTDKMHTKKWQAETILCLVAKLTGTCRSPASLVRTLNGRFHSVLAHTQWEELFLETPSQTGKMVKTTLKWAV